MSDRLHSDNEASLEHQRKQGTRWPYLLMMVLFLWTIVNYFGQQYANQQTIQNILDKDSALKALKVTTAKFPFYEALPLSSYLSEAGILPVEYSSFFAVSFKDGHRMTDPCSFSTYDYTVRKASSDKQFFQISGEEVRRLNACL